MTKIGLVCVALYLLSTPGWIGGCFLLYVVITHTITRNAKP